MSEDSKKVTFSHTILDVSSQQSRTISERNQNDAIIEQTLDKKDVCTGLTGFDGKHYVEASNLAETKKQHLLVFGPQKQNAETGAQWWCEYDGHCLGCAKCSAEVADAGHDTLKSWLAKATESWSNNKKPTEADAKYKWMHSMSGNWGSRVWAMSSQEVTAWTFFNGVGVPDLMTHATGLMAATKVHEDISQRSSDNIMYYKEFADITSKASSERLFVTLKMNWGKPNQYDVTTALFEVTDQGKSIFDKMLVDDELSKNIKFLMLPVKAGNSTTVKCVREAIDGIMARTPNVKENPGLQGSFNDGDYNISWMENNEKKTNNLFIGLDAWEAKPTSEIGRQAIKSRNTFRDTMAKDAGFKVVLTYYNPKADIFVNLAEIDQKFADNANHNALPNAIKCIPKIK